MFAWTASTTHLSGLSRSFLKSGPSDKHPSKPYCPCNPQLQKPERPTWIPFLADDGTKDPARKPWSVYGIIHSRCNWESLFGIWPGAFGDGGFKHCRFLGSRTVVFVMVFGFLGLYGYMIRRV